MAVNEDSLSVLFITRKYPPSIGGMECLSYHLTTEIAKRVKAYIISWGRGQWGLPLFLIWAFCRALIYFAGGQAKVIHLSDAALCPLGYLLRHLTQIPVVVSVHGLDVTYPSPLYQLMIRYCLHSMDRLVCNSQYTQIECLRRGALETQCAVIHPGVDHPMCVNLSEADKQAQASRWGLSLKEHHILLTVGRLVPRKGIAQFVAGALPELLVRRDDWLYLIVGEGPERANIEQAIERYNLWDHVKLIGAVSDVELWVAYNLADLFVMPNVLVPGNPEGFGMVLLEAQAAGLPVVAANTEGIREAAGGAEDCTLVEPGNWLAFCEAIERWLELPNTSEDRERRRERVITQHSWPYVADQYMKVFREVVAESSMNRRRAVVHRG